MQMDWYWPESVDLPGYKPTTKGHAKQIKDAARLMGEAHRPVLYVGGGILKARAAETLRELAELTGFPVVTTLMARGAFPDDHELCLGMPGMHGNYTAVTAMQKADLLIALGSRFDDRVTGKVGAFAPDAKIIHVDVDPAELGKVRRPDVPIVGDCRLVIEEMVKAVRAEKARKEWPAIDEWIGQLRAWQQQYPLVYEQFEDGPLKPQFCIDMLRDTHAGRHDRRVRRRPAPDVDEPALEVQLPVHLRRVRRPRHHGLRSSRGDRRQGRPARQDGVGDRR
jgi:acetolactate synthase-1/2/3 large subunit